MAPRTARPVLGGLAAALLLQQAASQTFRSATTPASTYSTLSFAGVTSNPSAAVSNSNQVTSSATINGVATPLGGFQLLARTGWTDTNGVVMGRVLVRVGYYGPHLRAGAGALRAGARWHC